MSADKSTLPLNETPKLTYDHSSSNITALLDDLTRTTPSIPSTHDHATRLSHASTKHSPASCQQTPCCVFYPQSTTHVSALLKACHARRIAVTSFAGGTSLGGALAASRGGVCVDFRDLGAVGEVWEADLMVAVGVGVGWVELNEKLEGRGLFWPVDPAPGARVGGMIAMSCSGTNAYRYGTVKDWLISMTLVLADGTVVKTRNRPRKSSAGYDLNHLIIGSEGTLALVTEAILKLAPLPTNLHVALSTFPAMQNGVDAALRILGSGHVLEAIELADSACMRAIETSGLAPRGREDGWEAKPTLFLKFAGSAGAVQEQLDFVDAVCKGAGGAALQFGHSRDFIATVWGARKCLANALVAMKKQDSDLFLSTDAAVPSSMMARLVEESNRIVKEEGAREWLCASVGHVGDGNVHTAIVCPASEKEKAGVLIEKIQRLALDLEGTVTGEHGVGLKLRDLVEEEVGEEGVALMRRIKMSLDPRGILNPDKVVRLEEGF